MKQVPGAHMHSYRHTLIMKTHTHSATDVHIYCAKISEIHTEDEDKNRIRLFIVSIHNNNITLQWHMGGAGSKHLCT